MQCTELFLKIENDSIPETEEVIIPTWLEENLSRSDQGTELTPAEPMRSTYKVHIHKRYIEGIFNVNTGAHNVMTNRLVTNIVRQLFHGIVSGHYNRINDVM